DEAVLSDQAQKFVWVVDDQSRVHYRQVKIGTLHDGLRVVTDGLTPADRVVIHGVQRARPDIVVVPEDKTLVPPADDGHPPGPAAVGALAALSLPVAQSPAVVPPTIVVTATYPGAPPEVIAATVATPIEQE